MSDCQCPKCGKFFMGYDTTSVIPPHNCITDETPYGEAWRIRAAKLQDERDALRAENERLVAENSELNRQLLELLVQDQPMPQTAATTNITAALAGKEGK